MMGLLIVAAALAGWQEPGEMAGDRVLAFAREQVGKKVGNGQCSALVAGALEHAGLDPRSNGRELESLKELKPGDILVFEDAAFRFKSGRRTYWAKFPHHVAIVATVGPGGRAPALSILHQNAGQEGGDPDERMVVQRWTLRMSQMTKGTVKAYRPGE
jgi:hypothetical protein